MATTLEPYSQLGLFEFDVAIFPDSKVSNNFQQPSLVGELPGQRGSKKSSYGDPVPNPPSTFIKALSFTLLNFMTSSSDLSLESKAFFIAPVSQAGIPGGEFVDAPITNYQLFLKADAVQKQNYPLYAVDDASSYYSLLSRYMRYMNATNTDPAINAARMKILDAESQKDMQWGSARQAYVAMRETDPNGSQTFVDYLMKYQGYNDAWAAEQKAQKDYEALLPLELVDVSRQLDIIKSANDRLIYKINNNMPCYAMDLDYVRESELNNGRLHLDQRDIYYRPFYSLTDYERTCNNWNKPSLPRTSVSYPISLDPRELGTWAELGHGALDKSSATTFTTEQADLLASVKATITFSCKPAVISVERGLWDVVPLKSSCLSIAAPSYLKRPFMKTTKLLITKGFDIDIQIPTAYTGSTSGLRINRWGIPLSNISDDQKHLKFSADGESYPIILAALGSLVGGDPLPFVMASKGVERRSTGVPSDFSASALKFYLGNYFKTAFGWNGSFDFQIVFDRSAEAIIWSAWETQDSGVQATKTALVIDPTPSGEGNLLAQLRASLDLPVTPSATLHLGVETVPNAETPNVKFDDLLGRKFKPKFSESGPTLTTDWILGDIVETQYGNFVRTDTVTSDTFQKEGVWSLPPGSAFNKLSFFGDQWPPMFQVCLQDLPDQDEKRRREWMDLHMDDNIRGIIFDSSSTLQLATVWFVLDKPPQFYQRTQKAPAPVAGASAGDLPAWAVGPGHILIQPANVPDMVKARIRYPTRNPDPIERHICGIPLDIQYSRVIRVTYKPSVKQDFTFDAFKGRLSAAQQEKIVLLEGYVPSADGPIDSLNALQNNMSEIQKVPHECQIAFIKLLYNRNLPIMEGEIEALRQQLNTSGFNLRDNPQLLADLLGQSAHNMETSQVRSLRRLHISAKKKLPSDLVGRLVEPAEAVREAVKGPSFTNKYMRTATKASTFKIMVFPSHIEIFGPETVLPSQITDTYKDKINRFIRVRFLDNDGNPFKIEPGINADLIINERIVNVLNGFHHLLPLPGFDFEFLGYSVSSLKQKKMVWFFRKGKGDSTTSETIRSRIGIWDAASSSKAAKLAGFPFKWSARFALAFTTSIPIREIGGKDYTSNDDYPKDATFPNTDGCGIISSTLGTEINRRMQDVGYNAAHAFQIRLGGVKGMVYQAPDVLFPSTTGEPVPLTLLRSSNIKFDLPSGTAPTLRIAATIGDFQRSIFFESLIQALENLGADSAEILKAYDTGYESLTSVNDRTIRTLQDIVQMSDDNRDTESMSRYGLLKLAGNLMAANISQSLFGDTSFLTLYLKSLSKWALNKNMFAIPIPGAFSNLGFTDDFKILTGKEEGNPDHRKKPYEVVILANKQFVSGDVLIYRDPIIHIGDLKLATALTKDEVRNRMAKKYGDNADVAFNALSAMDNVIFFSQEDRPPLPNRLSGGDLDGDRFEIIPKDGCKFWNALKDQPSADYAAEPDKTKGPQRLKDDFNIKDLTNFLGQYIRQDCFDELQTTLIALADVRPLGLMDPDVMELSTHISNAVDFAKSGVPVDLWTISQDPKFKITAKANVLRARNLQLRYSHGGDYYKSTKLLGKVYAKGVVACDKMSKLSYPQRLDNGPLAKQVDENRKLASLSNGNLEDFVSKMRDAIGVFVQEQFVMYRGYLKGRNIPASSEMDVFMKKPRDANFPEAHTNGIVDFLKTTMVHAVALQIETDESQKSLGYAWKLAAGMSMDDTIVIFKQCAYEAWKSALACLRSPTKKGELSEIKLRREQVDPTTLLSTPVQTYDVGTKTWNGISTLSSPEKALGSSRLDRAVQVKLYTPAFYAMMIRFGARPDQLDDASFVHDTGLPSALPKGTRITKTPLSFLDTRFQVPRLFTKFLSSLSSQSLFVHTTLIAVPSSVLSATD
ncbi:hypothetical protein OPT61_g1352 [Boeremia exigua]|uniref:Uncharacterized protein n=1 Tax=Boeremia exigua TaxID=749465 RepID=A0ACC2IQN0_9PLEO|nr:hypothetical protein OPT61_g1352 [Boeremia exigua]